MSWSPLLQGIHRPFLYIHPPKTAGRWVSKVLQDYEIARALDVEGYPGQFHPLAEHTDWRAFGDLPGIRISTIRDPWSWYQSMVRYHTQRNGFDNWIKPYREAVGTENHIELIRAMVDPVKFGVKEFDGCTPPIETTTGPGMSLYTYTFKTVTGLRSDMTAQVDLFIDSRRINDSLPDALRYAGCTNCGPFTDPPHGVSLPGKEPCMDARLIKRIGKVESWITEPFGFRYDKPSPFRMWVCRRGDSEQVFWDHNLDMVEIILTQISNGVTADHQEQSRNALKLLRQVRNG